MQSWTRILLTDINKCSNHECLQQQLTNYQGVRETSCKNRSRGPTTWKDTRESALKDVVSWQTKRQSSCTMSQVLAWMITTSRRKSWKRMKKCTEYARRCSWNASIWHELVDLTFFGQWTNLLEQSHNGQESVTNAEPVWFHSFITQMTTDNIVMWVIQAQHCRLGLFQDSDFAGDLEDSNSTSGENLMYLWKWNICSHGRLCKKRTSVSHSSTESEVISLEAGLRMDCIRALVLWDVVIEVLHSSKNTHQAVRDHCRKEEVDDQKHQIPTPSWK